MKILDHLEEWLIAFLMGAATLIVFVAVVHRYTAGYAIPGLQDWLLSVNLTWAQELTIIMFVWMAKFGAAYGVRTGIHVGVDVLINRMQTPLRSKFIIFGLAAGALFTGVVAWMGGKFVWENGAHYGIFNALGMNVEHLIEGPTTPDLEWPTWVVYSAIPLGSGLMCFRFLQVLVSFIRTGELPHHDHGHVDGLDDDEEPVVAPPFKDAGEADPYGLRDNLHPDETGKPRGGKP
ncbi:MAG: TRAP transporter small permease protein [Burkholderiales bacterium 66-5]|uniref:TRAP transporter small permease n=1 Tax=Comamonas badia TaxID=265291 RepID=UPI000465DEB2|nr:TRAP transporter small permease [Comamonas badia]OJU88488.1 MAG: TRAP transporter small permease protein [Burkholderiales bacterium 66-5]